MSERSKIPSPAMIVALLALVVATSGVAYAAGKIGGKDIKAQAIKTSKIKDGAVTDKKLRNGAVTADKLAPGAVSPSVIADGSITAAKLEPGERSQAFTASHGQVSLPSATDTVAIQTSLPVPGNYVMTVSGLIGNATGAANFVSCQLLDANNPLATSGTALTGSATFQQTISLTGVSDGGTVRLSCNPNAGAAIKELRLTATRVNTVETLTATP